MSAPTKAQRAVLAWLVEKHDDHELRGGDFIDYYGARADADTRARGLPESFIGHHSTGRKHAWRRTGGTVLARLERQGFVRHVRFSWGTSIYVLTDEGRRVGREALAE